MDDVVVRHHRQRRPDVGTAEGIQDPHGSSAILERTVVGRLDSRPVHHRIREGHPDLDGIGACRGNGPDRVKPVLAQAARRIGH